MQKTIISLGCIVLLVIGGLGDVQARQASPYYAKAYLGFADYQGDRTNWSAGSLATLGPSLGGEVGIMVLPPWGSVAVQGGLARFSDLGRAGAAGPRVTPLDGSGGRSRLSVSLMGRLHAPAIGPINLYGHMGPAFMFGWVNQGARVGFGPRLGGGGDLAIRDELRLFGEINTLFVLPDGAADLSRQDDTEHDLFLFFDFGLRYNIPQPREALRLLTTTGPEVLAIGAVGAFSGTVNREDVTDNNFKWNFGDGNTATGASVSHIFDTPGTYMVEFIATHGKEQVSEQVEVTVQDLVAAPRITNVQFSPTPHHAGNRLQFAVTPESEVPATCVWDFGDSSYAKGCEASHIYAAEGVYTLVLEVSNTGGADRFTQTVYVRKPEEAACIAELELESAFFETNATALNVTARTALRRNLVALLACPSARIQINGYALPDERNPEVLAQERIEAVQDYYTTSGLVETRIVGFAQDVVTDLSASAPKWQYRFAESVVVK